MLGTRTPGRLPASRHEHYLIPTGNSITESHQCSDMTQDAASFPPRAAGVIHETSPYGHERSNSLKDGGPTSSRPQDSFTVPLGLNAEDTPTSRIKGDNTLSSHLKDENTPALRGSRGREGIVSPDTTPASRGSRGRIGSLVGEHIPASPGSGGMKWSMSEERTPTFCERGCQKVTLDGRTPASPRSSCREAWLSEECTPVPFGSSCRKIWVKGTPSRGGGTTVAARPAHKDAKRSVASDPVEAPTKVRRKPDANDGSIRRASKSKRDHFSSFDELPPAIDSRKSRQAVVEVYNPDYSGNLSVNDDLLSQGAHASPVRIQNARSSVKDIVGTRASKAQDAALVPDEFIGHQQKGIGPENEWGWLSVYDGMPVVTDAELSEENGDRLMQLEDDALFSQTEEELFSFSRAVDGAAGQHRPLEKEDSLLGNDYVATDLPEAVIPQKTYMTLHEPLQNAATLLSRASIAAAHSGNNVFREDYHLSEDDITEVATQSDKENEDDLHHSQEALFALSEDAKGDDPLLLEDIFSADLTCRLEENHEHPERFQHETTLFSPEVTTISSQPKDNSRLLEDDTFSAHVSEGTTSPKNNNAVQCSRDTLLLHSRVGDDDVAMPLREENTPASEQKSVTLFESGHLCATKATAAPPLHVGKDPATLCVEDELAPKVTAVETERNGHLVVDDILATVPHHAEVPLSSSEEGYHGGEELMFNDDAFDSSRVYLNHRPREENLDAGQEKEEITHSVDKGVDVGANEDTSSLDEDIFADCWIDETSNASTLALPVTKETGPRALTRHKPALTNGVNVRPPKPKVTIKVLRRGKTSRSQLQTTQNIVEPLAALSSWSVVSPGPFPHGLPPDRHKSSSSSSPRANEANDRRTNTMKGSGDDTHSASNGASSPWRVSQTGRSRMKILPDAPFSEKSSGACSLVSSQISPRGTSSVAMALEKRLPSSCCPPPQVQTGIRQDDSDARAQCNAPEPRFSQSQETLKRYPSAPPTKDTISPTNRHRLPAALASQPRMRTPISVSSADCHECRVPCSPTEFRVAKKTGRKQVPREDSHAGSEDANAQQGVMPRNVVKLPQRASVKRPLDGRVSAGAIKRPKADQEIAVGRDGAPLVRLLCQAWWHRDRLPASHLDWKDSFAVKYNEERKKPNNRNWPQLSTTHTTVSDDTLVLQSMIYANSGGKSDAALWIVPRSHLSAPSLPSSDLKNIHNERVSDPSELRNRLKLDLPTGSAVFWDSRLVHQGGRSEYIMKRTLKTYHLRSQQVKREQEQQEQEQQQENQDEKQKHLHLPDNELVGLLHEVKQRQWHPMAPPELSPCIPSSSPASTKMEEHCDEADVLPIDVAPCITPHFFAYPTNDNEWADVREYFATEGYIAIRDFLDADEVAVTLAEFVDDVKYLCPHARDTVRDINDITCGMVDQNIAKNALLGSINFGRAAWRMRLHPRRIRVYAELHNCMEEELVTSLDGGFFAPQASDAEPKPPQRLAFSGCLMHKMHLAPGRQQQKLAMAVLGIRTTTHWPSTVELARWTYRSYYAGPLRKVGGYFHKYECRLHKINTLMPEYVQNKVTEEERTELLEAIKLEEKVIGTQGLGGLPLIMAWPTERLKELLGDKAKWI